ncbi:MAG: hypothetical protein ACK5O2_02260 [Microthrixaceae bacterium]
MDTDRTRELGDQGPALPSDPSVIGEILAIPPRLASRTIAQVQATQRLLSMIWTATAAHMPDAGGAPKGEPPAEVPEAHDKLEEPVDVLSVLTDDLGVGNRTDDLSVGTGTDAPDPGADVPATPTPGPVPSVDELPIPGYDSLAASQVVPRLNTMTESELNAIGAYEASNRARRTILNRVTQLQGK